MKRHLTLSIAGQHALDRGDTAEAITDRTPAGDRQSTLSEAAHTRPQLTLASELVWRHKLLLTGKLDHCSASELEEEIECLCEEGVTTLTLDLRHLDAIDPTGATTIARRGAICKMRGHDFTVVAGSRTIRRVLAEAGATDLLTPDQNASVVRRFPSRSADDSATYRSTMMIKSL
jgi:anti-anti-sigma factor